MNGSSLLLAAVLGMLLGVVFFVGLWSTVRRLPASQHPGLLLLGSGLFRLGIALTGFYVLARFAGLMPLLVGLAGFLLVRVVLVGRIKLIDGPGL